MTLFIITFLFFLAGLQRDLKTTMLPFCWGGKNYEMVSPFDWRHLNLPVRGYPMCGYCFSCEDVDHEAAQIAASAARASSICYPAAQAAAPFLRPCAAPTGLNAMNGLVRRGRGCSNPSFGDLKVDSWIQSLKMFKASTSIFDDVSPQVSPKVFA